MIKVKRLSKTTAIYNKRVCPKFIALFAYATIHKRIHNMCLA